MNNIIKIGLILIVGILLIPTASAAGLMDKIQEFIKNDTTDQHKYLPWYSCGHYSRDLAKNASVESLPIGSIMLSNHPVFRGKWNSHIMNYIDISGQIYLIEPQTDHIYPLNQSMYNYYRLYPNGTQVPSNWNVNLAHTGEIK